MSLRPQNVHILFLLQRCQSYAPFFCQKLLNPYWTCKLVCNGKWLELLASEISKINFRTNFASVSIQDVRATPLKTSYSFLLQRCQSYAPFLLSNKIESLLDLQTCLQYNVAKASSFSKTSKVQCTGKAKA